MNIQVVGDKLIPVPITSKTKFALIPNDDRDSERILDKDWEGTFTDVSKILKLPILPLVSVPTVCSPITVKLAQYKYLEVHTNLYILLIRGTQYQYWLTL